MNTIINVSNIFFKNKNTDTNDKNTHDIISPDQETTVNEKIIDNKIYTDTNIQDAKEEVKFHTLRNAPKSKKQINLVKIFHTILYEFLLMFFYIILSPFYFFDTYTTKINSSSLLNSDPSNISASLGLVDKDLGSEEQERLFFPKKLIPQSVLTKRKILILDLDETLIHSTNVSEELSSKFEKLDGEDIRILDGNVSSINMETPDTKHIRTFNKVDSFQIEVSFKLPKNTNIPAIFANSHNTKQTNVTSIYKVYQRPYLIQFLKTCNIWYDIIIYTASLREYSEPIITQLEELSGVRFIHKLYRKDCKAAQSGYIKPLDYITEMFVQPDLASSHPSSDLGGGKRKSNKFISKESMIIIDNMPVSFKEDVNNGIQIKSWYGDPRDIELLKLLPLLEGLKNVADVRLVIGLRTLNPELLN